MIIFYCTLALLALLEPQIPSRVWPLLALIVFIVFTKVIAKRHRAALTIMFAMTLYKVLILISLLMIAWGATMRELGLIASGPVYSLYFCLLACIFLHAACSSFNWCSHTTGRFRRASPAPIFIPIIIWAGVVLLGVVIGTLLAKGMATGFPLIVGVDRFVYRAQSDWVFNFIVTSKPIMAAMLGVIRFRLVRTHVLQWAIDLEFVVFVGTLVLFGDKFVSVIVLVGFYVLPMLLKVRAGAFSLSPSIVFGALALAAAVGGVTYYVYSDYGASGWAATSQRLMSRAAGQGQLWYASMQTGNDLVSADSAQINDLLDVMGVGGAGNAVGQNVGIFYLILRYAPANIYASIQEGRGLVQFTGGFEAYLLLIGGHLAMMLGVAVSGLVAGIVSLYYYNSLLCGSLPGVGAAAFIYMSVYTMVNQAAVWVVFGARALIYIAAVVLIDVVARALLQLGTVRQDVVRFPTRVYAESAGGRSSDKLSE